MSLQALSETIRYFQQRGWADATGTNYSTRDTEQPRRLWISRSGVDKRFFLPTDFIATDMQGVPLADASLRTSAETGLHTLIYDCFSQAACVLHTHSPHATVASLKYPKGMVFRGMEMQKAIAGVTTHETELPLPVFANSQDIPTLASQVRAHLADHPHCYGYLIAGHGLYAWGSSLAEATRHIEAWEFLIYTQLLLDTHGNPTHS